MGAGRRDHGDVGNLGSLYALTVGHMARAAARSNQLGDKVMKTLVWCMVLSWWWLNLQTGYGLQRYGPYLEQSACQYQASQYAARGWVAFCTEERH